MGGEQAFVFGARGRGGDRGGARAGAAFLPAPARLPYNSSVPFPIKDPAPAPTAPVTI